MSEKARAPHLPTQNPDGPKVLLPHDYRAFLLKHNGGELHPADFDYSDGTELMSGAVVGG